MPPSLSEPSLPPHLPPSDSSPSSHPPPPSPSVPNRGSSLLATRRSESDGGVSEASEEKNHARQVGWSEEWAAEGTARARLPILSFHMDGSVVFSSPVRNYFIEVASEVNCLVMRRAEAGEFGFFVIDNLMQQGRLQRVGDLQPSGAWERRCGKDP